MASELKSGSTGTCAACPPSSSSVETNLGTCCWEDWRLRCVGGVLSSVRGDGKGVCAVGSRVGDPRQAGVDDGAARGVAQAEGYRLAVSMGAVSAVASCALARPSAPSSERTTDLATSARLWLIRAAADLADLADGSVEAPEMAAGLSMTELADLMGGWGDIRGDMALGERGEPERLRDRGGQSRQRPLTAGKQRGRRGCCQMDQERDGVMARAAAAIKLGKLQSTVSKPTSWSRAAGHGQRGGIRREGGLFSETDARCFALPQEGWTREQDGAQRTFWELPGRQASSGRRKDYGEDYYVENLRSEQETGVEGELTRSEQRSEVLWDGLEADGRGVRDECGSAGKVVEQLGGRRASGGEGLERRAGARHSCVSRSLRLCGHGRWPKHIVGCNTGTSRGVNNTTSLCTYTRCDIPVLGPWTYY